MSACSSHLLINTAEVLQDVVHAAFLQHLTRVGLSEAVNPHTVHLIHLPLHEATAGLSDSHHVQQVGRCQESLQQRDCVQDWKKREGKTSGNDGVSGTGGLFGSFT